MSDQKPSSEQPNDTGKAPKFVPSHPGRAVSERGLIERIVEQYLAEHGSFVDREPIGNDETVTRRSDVRDAAEYIFGVESVLLEPRARAQVIAQAYSEIFGFGPLDALLLDPEVTTVTLEGARKVAIRRGPGAQLEQLAPIFADIPQMREVVERLLHEAGAQLRDDVPIIEAGLLVEKRRVSVNVVAPPLVAELAVDIRLHPQTLPTLDDWVEREIMSPDAAQLLRAIAQAPHGIVVVGDTESGKTTLLSMLARLLPAATSVCAVERAGELRLPDHAQRFVVRWPTDDHSGLTFGEQIHQAYDEQPDVLLLDEVRSDEPELIAPLLNRDDAPRLMWSFRGASESRRLRSALGMIARMSDRSQSEAMVYQLYKRLPFVVVLKRRKDRLELREIAEWQFPDNAEDSQAMVYADYVPLLHREWEGLEKTGKQPKLSLDLPEDYWDVGT